ncbi:MAG: HD domain-containing protein [Fibrobacter sp.]|jgi:response regulator RpfG family c-di-GMP phosphodiesterase|uniref:HD domain-containing phosphohydrolase n=1 Tax=Fibrobacter sp. UWB5 TaxID=1964360 RepID=UPI000B5249BE|nr:HD domain-containing phosphohydrolase [Fibrobacter sp. UWB5]MBR4679528.1 HD domain-containing protein [Fibrobacter sp.]OWV12263.1 phosphohydrolase [Fibrobacter sp. UWB5]
MTELDERQVVESQRILELLFAYMPKIAAERKMDGLLILMADLGRSIVAADRCSLWLVDNDRGELWTKVAHGVSELRIPHDAGFVGYSVKTGEPLLIKDAYQDPRFDRRSDEKTHYRTTSVMTVPLMNSAGNVMGVFQAINKQGTNEQGEAAVFSIQDLERLSLTAVYSAKTVESAMLNMELEATQREIIHILGEVSEYRSQETGDHIQRVAEISYMLAKFLGLPEVEVERIRLAAPMHDLGKVGIPDAILNKPGRFTDDEYAIMKTHSEIGYNMLHNSKRQLLRFAAEISRSHHERWDGRGYPRGIAGEEIPLAGRICSVADVLDALSSPRCYKQPWPEEKVKEEFLKQRGAQFQPELVDVLMEHWDEIYSLYRRNSD